MSSFDNIIAEITEKISAEFPQIKDILDRAQKGELSEEQALGLMMGFTNKNPTIANKIANIFMENAQGDGEIESENEVFVIPKQSAKKTDSLYETVWEDRTESGKRARFNPQYESYLAERLQFDGDAPELRTGPMDKDTTPAVDVVAKSVNPIVVGDQLKRASKQVREEQDRLEEEHTKKLSDNLESSTEITKVGTELDRSLIPQPEGYENGKLPVPRNIEEMSSSELLCLSKDIKRENIWNVLATTQGRRSVSDVIAEIIKDRLATYGIRVKINSKGTGKVMGAAYWTITIKSAKEIQDNFSLIETCAYSLAYNLSKGIKDDYDPNVEYSLFVKTINEYSVREVGWGARIMME